MGVDLFQECKRTALRRRREFFVDRTCIDCDVCRWMAPIVYSRKEGQSAVHHQPTSDEERRKALRIGKRNRVMYPECDDYSRPESSFTRQHLQLAGLPSADLGQKIALKWGSSQIQLHKLGFGGQKLVWQLDLQKKMRGSRAIMVAAAAGGMIRRRLSRRALAFERGHGFSINQTRSCFGMEHEILSARARMSPATGSLQAKHFRSVSWKPPTPLVDDQSESSETEDMKLDTKQVVIAIGGNVGDRLGNFNRALDMLKDYGIRVMGCGCLYESAPAYVTDQPRFLNSAVRAITALEPHALLRALKKIEKSLGRSEGGVRYGPRPVDLDIIFYDAWTVKTDDLQIPHPRLAERDFVLAPVVDLLDSEYRKNSPSHWGSHASLKGGILAVWNDLGGEELVGKVGLQRVTPIGGKLWDWNQRTHIMGVLNITPDSFSDGGLYTKPKDALEQVKRMVSEGADFIDVGAQSSRPGAKRLTVEEELDRALPILDTIASDPDLQGISLSIDTFNSLVVEEAVARGVQLVNDISAGRLDEEMWNTVSKLGVSYAAMHMRGEPRVMQKESNTQYMNLCEEVAPELASSVREAELCGIPSWRIITDPGLGFSKTAEQSIALMRDLKNFRQQLFKTSTRAIGHGPILFGPSRKSFLGKLCGRSEGKDRDFATAAAVVVGVAGGADNIRAHNVGAVRDAIRVAEAVYEMKSFRVDRKSPLSIVDE